jgi:hypothetical protein
VKAAPWWTEADAAELDVLAWELVERVPEHEAQCRTCQALAEPCSSRAAIAREADAFDRAPLSAPTGFYAAMRRRLAEHEASCRRCELARPGHCAAVDEAIAAVLEWRWKRGLLSRAQYLRQRQEEAA